MDDWWAISKKKTFWHDQARSGTIDQRLPCSTRDLAVALKWLRVAMRCVLSYFIWRACCIHEDATGRGMGRFRKEEALERLGSTGHRVESRADRQQIARDNVSVFIRHCKRNSRDRLAQEQQAPSQEQEPGLKRDTIPSGLEENVTLPQGSSVTRNPGLEDTSPLGLSSGESLA